MEIIIADSDRYERGFAPESTYLDVDIGVDNNYQLTIPISEFQKMGIVFDQEQTVNAAPSKYFYMENEEIGGELHDPFVDTEEETVTFTAPTFRGMLNEQFVEPPAGQSHLTVSGELNKIIKTLVESRFTSLFAVSGNSTGKNVTVEIGRYYSVLEAIEQVLNVADYKLEIKTITETTSSGNRFRVMLEAAPRAELEEEEIEISQDYGVQFSIQKITNFYRYMLALGSGENEERMVLKLHYTDAGKVVKVSSIPKDVRVYKYDYGSIKTDEEMMQEALEKFIEINPTDNTEMTVGEKINLNYGDRVASRDYVTGMVISQLVTRKIFKLDDGVVTKSYVIGEV